MEKFAFIIHPLNTADIARKFPWQPKTGKDTGRIFRYLPPWKYQDYRIAFFHAEAEGWFVACSLTARQMELPRICFGENNSSREKAEKLGAKIVGLGAFTSVVGDAGITIARNLNIPVTSGNSYTVATAIAGTKMAAREMGIDLGTAEVAVIGATGSIGSTCARILARECRYLTLWAQRNNLQRLAQKVGTGLAAKISSFRIPWPMPMWLLRWGGRCHN